MYKKILLLCIGISFIGCVHPARVKIPGNTFHSPESSGKTLGGRLEVRWGGTADVTIVDSVTEASPQVIPKVGEEGAIGVGIDLGLVSFMDIYYSGSESFSEVLGLHLQLIGDSQMAAKAGNFSIALWGGTFLGRFTTTKKSDGVEGHASNDYDGYEAGLSLGYRSTDKILIYFSPFYKELEGKTTVYRTVNSVVATTASPEGNGNIYGASIGIMVNRSATGYFKIDGGFARTKWTRTLPAPNQVSDLDEIYAGIAGGTWW